MLFATDDCWLKAGSRHRRLGGREAAVDSISDILCSEIDAPNPSVSLSMAMLGRRIVEVLVTAKTTRQAHLCYAQVCLSIGSPGCILSISQHL